MTGDGMPAVRWLNYPGDQRLAVGQIVGPNLLGEYLVATTAAYDPGADRTRMGFRYAVPADLEKVRTW